MKLSSPLHFDATLVDLTLSVALFTLSVAIPFQKHIFKRESVLPDACNEKTSDTKEEFPSNQQPEWVAQFRVRLLQAISALYLLGLGIMTYRISGQVASIDCSIMHSLTSMALASFAFLLQWTSLQSGINSPVAQGRPRWIEFVPGWVALLGSSVSIFPLFYQAGTFLFVGGRSTPNSKVKVDDLWKFSSSITGDMLERALLGSLAIRYAILCALGVLSVGILSGVLDTNVLQLPSNLFKDPLVSAPMPEIGFLSLSASSTNSHKGKDKQNDDNPEKTTEKEEGPRSRSAVFRAVFALRMTYPSGVRKLEILYLARIGIMMFGRVITLYTPVQTERILRTFSQNNLDTNGTPVLSTFDMASIVSYVLYDYLQRYSNVLQALDQIINSPVDGHVQNSMTLRFFEHVHTLSMGYHYDTNSAKTISAMRVGVRSTANVSETLLFKILPNMLDVILSVAYFWFAWGWKYGLLITINGCLYAVVIYFVERYKANAWKGHHNSTYDADMRAVDSLQNFETVKYFTNEGFELDRYRQGLVGHIEEALKERAKHYLLLAPRDLLWSWNLFAGCMLCAYEIAQENRDPSSFMTFVLHSKQLEGPVDSFGWMFRMLRHEFTHMDNLLDILELEPTVKDIPNAPPLASPSTTSKASGEIEFEDVSFQYGSDKKGLSNISFKIPQGSTVGIVGPTGSGKSTLLRLAFRLWDPTSGRILIDGQDISKVTQRSVREQIGVVPQDTALLNESILYNIGYARPSATKAEIEEAAKAAQIHDSIMSFEHDYNTSVGERGAKLSGGERQRIGIARVVLKNPPIILLDEATSALDSTTESEIQKALNAMTQNRTTLVVAHRLSTIMHADLILFVKDGRIVEQGTHEELVQRAVDKGGKGEYYKMWRIQSGECSSSSSSASTVGEDETHITSLAITPADPADPSDLAKSVPEGPTSTSEKKTEE